jgi:hypothetical protein
MAVKTEDSLPSADVDDWGLKSGKGFGGEAKDVNTPRSIVPQLGKIISPPAETKHDAWGLTSLFTSFWHSAPNKSQEPELKSAKKRKNKKEVDADRWILKSPSMFPKLIDPEEAHRYSRLNSEDGDVPVLKSPQLIISKSPTRKDKVAELPWQMYAHHEYDPNRGHTLQKKLPLQLKDEIHQFENPKSEKFKVGELGFRRPLTSALMTKTAKGNMEKLCGLTNKLNFSQTDITLLMIMIMYLNLAIC